MARKALRDLSRYRPGAGEEPQLFNTLLKESDKGLALIGATVMKDALEHCFSRKFIHGLGTTCLDDIFNYEGPLGSFSNRIKIAYALGTFNSVVRDELEIIRDIRNAFAHSVIHLSISTKEIAEATEELVAYHLLDESLKVNDILRGTFTMTIVNLYTFLSLGTFIEMDKKSHPYVSSQRIPP